MAFEELKSLIIQNVRTNGTESITGAMMQRILLEMVDELGSWTGGGISPFATEDWVTQQLVNYATITALGLKQDTLVSGTNIKTINNESLLGSGNITIEQSGGDYLPLVGGTLTGNLIISGDGLSKNLNIHYLESADPQHDNIWNAYLYHNKLSFTYTGYGEQESAPMDLQYVPKIQGYSQLNVGGNLQAIGFLVPWGTNDMFLKAGGGVDTNVYLTQDSADQRYLRLSGGTVVGNVIIDGHSFTVYNDEGSNPVIQLQEFSTGSYTALIFLDKDDNMLHLSNDSGAGILLDDNVWATSYHKSGSNNNEILCGGGGVKALGNVGGTWLGVCSTAASTSAKTVNLSDFILYPKVTISIRFMNAINVPDATLNVNSTGAKPIKINGNNLQYGVINAGMTAILQYDDTNWNIVSLMGEEQSSKQRHTVDLGLPSGTLWAASNIDVTQEDGFAEHTYSYGSYFSWGNNKGYNPVGGTFQDVHDWGTSVDGQPYASSLGHAVTANLSPQMDMARANLGAPWRLPTKDDFQELYDNCTWTWAQLGSSVNGYIITSHINGISLSLPAAGYGFGTSLDYLGSDGYYWSSSFYSSAYAYLLYFHSGGIYPQNYLSRFYGFSVRAVQ